MKIKIILAIFSIILICSSLFLLEITVSPDDQSWARRALMISGNTEIWKFTSAYFILYHFNELFFKNIVILNMFSTIVLLSIGGLLGYKTANNNTLLFKQDQEKLLVSLFFVILSTGIFSYYKKNIFEYNHLCFINVSVIFLILLNQLKQEKISNIWSIIIGILLGLLLTVKISAGVMFLILFIFFNKKRFYFKQLLFISIWAVTIYFLILETIKAPILIHSISPGLNSFPEFRDEVTNWFSSKKNFLSATTTYLLRLIFLNFIEISVLVIFCFVIKKIADLKHHYNLKKNLTLIISLWIFLSFLYFIYGGDAYQTADKHNYSCIYFWFGKVCWYGLNTIFPILGLIFALFPNLLIISRNNIRKSLLALFFFLSPLAISFGTAFRLSHNMIIYYPFLISGLILLQKNKNAFIQKKCIFIVMIITSFQISGNIFLLLKQKIQLHSWQCSLEGFPNGNYLKCSKDTYQWISKVGFGLAQEGLNPGDLVLSRKEYLLPYLFNLKPVEVNNTTQVKVIINSTKSVDYSSQKSRKRSLITALIGPSSIQSAPLENLICSTSSTDLILTSTNSLSKTDLLRIQRQ